MNIFVLIRRSLWCIILAVCLVISVFYFALSTTLLTRDGLQKVVAQSKLAETVRSEILLPKVLQTTHGSEYSSLLDDATVTTALNSAASNETLDRKLDPAVDSVWRWLNSQEPNVEFSIPMSSVSDAFAGTLAGGVDSKIATLPACTYRNTLADAEAGACRSSLITKDVLVNKITSSIQHDTTLKENLTLTPQSTGLSAALSGSASDVPSYLNMLYAAALVTVAIAALIGLWLLIKHRLAGIITIGVAGILAALLLYIITAISSTRAGTFSTDPQLQLVARSGVTILETTLHTYSLILASAGLGLVIIGAISIYFYRKRHPRQSSVHLSSETNTQ